VKLFKPKTIWLPTWQGWILLCLLLAGFLVTIFSNIHRFLAVTNRVAGADILVMEAWVPEVVVQAAVKEFKEGGYQLLLISDLREHDDRDGRSQDVRKLSVINRIISLGIPRDRIIECFGPATYDHRSAAMAIAVRDALQQGGITSKGLNVIAPAAHARKTWLVYQRVLVSETQTGCVAVPTEDYDSARWWRTTTGAKWVITNGISWLYEWISSGQ
jgi:hypothetical protein